MLIESQSTKIYDNALLDANIPNAYKLCDVRKNDFDKYSFIFFKFATFVFKKSSAGFG